MIGPLPLPLLSPPRLPWATGLLAAILEASHDSTVPCGEHAHAYVAWCKGSICVARGLASWVLCLHALSNSGCMEVYVQVEV